MWKLFISVLAMSDTGSLATTAIVTDYPSQQSCSIAQREMTGPPVTRELNGHNLTIQTFTVCKPVADGAPQVAEGYGPGYDPRVRSSRPGYVPLPPPIQGIINGVLQGFNGRY